MTLKKHLVAFILAALFAVAPCAWAEEDGYFVEVESGDSLFGLVRMHYPDKPSRWSLIENEIFVTNPQAFSDGDKSKLRLGAILKFPSYDEPGQDKDDAAESPDTLPRQQNLAMVGSVTELSGTPLAIDINNEQRLLHLHGNVFRGDAILTEGDSAVHLQLSDGAHLFVRAGSRLVIDDYIFFEDSPRSSRSIITLLKGGFRTITGLIGKRNPAAVRINTAVATIGVRGTDFALRICGPSDCSLPEHGLFEAGDYSGVLGGEITINNASGTTPVGFGEIMRTATPDSAPVPAPEAAALIFTESEMALLEPKKQKPMNFFQWLRSHFSRKNPE